MSYEVYKPKEIYAKTHHNQTSKNNSLPIGERQFDTGFPIHGDQKEVARHFLSAKREELSTQHSIPSENIVQK